MGNKSSKVLSSGMHVAHCTTYMMDEPTTALEAQRVRDEGAADMAAQIEEGIEKRLGELVYADRVAAAIRSLTCSKCRGSGLLRSPRGEEGGVKYCACPLGAERYGTPEFLQLCTDQAKEQRAAGRLAIAAALERYVESKLLSAKPGESILSAAKRAEKVPPKPPKMVVVKD